jgi:hypothetical protein
MINEKIEYLIELNSSASCAGALRTNPISLLRRAFQVKKLVTTAASSTDTSLHLPSLPHFVAFF